MKQLLVQVGWTQAEFARQIGASENTVSAWVSKQPDTLAYRVAVKYLEVLCRVIK